jgi:hypothetical protein
MLPLCRRRPSVPARSLFSFPLSMVLRIRTASRSDASLSRAAPELIQVPRVHASPHEWSEPRAQRTQVSDCERIESRIAQQRPRSAKAKSRLCSFFRRSSFLRLSLLFFKTGPASRSDASLPRAAQERSQAPRVLASPHEWSEPRAQRTQVSDCAGRRSDNTMMKL